MLIYQLFPIEPVFFFFLSYFKNGKSLKSMHSFSEENEIRYLDSCTYGHKNGNFFFISLQQTPEDCGQSSTPFVCCSVGFRTNAFIQSTTFCNFFSSSTCAVLCCVTLVLHKNSAAWKVTVVREQISTKECLDQHNLCYMGKIAEMRLLHEKLLVLFMLLRKFLMVFISWLWQLSELTVRV